MSTTREIKLQSKVAELRTAAGYIRESTDDQLEYSPEAQRKELRRFAQQNGYILDENNIFIDEAYPAGRQKSARSFSV
jgi:DNA invertase Pin-like site-specific DNA recombinase